MKLNYGEFAPTMGTTVIILIIIGILWFLCDMVIEEDRQADLLMAHCMADGHKDYECHGMLDIHDTMIPMPVYINSGG